MITITPLAAFTPYIAVADASFKTSIRSISSGLMLAIALPIKFTLSKLFNSSAEIGTGSSKIIPSTTQTGSRFPEIEEAPRIRTFGAAPGVEVGLIIFTPANFPCNILSIEIAAPSCNSDPFTLITELAFLRLSIR